VAQRPVELIMARNLMASLSTPAFLVDEEGSLVFYNDAAAKVLGMRFEEAGRMPPEEWSTAFGPLDSDGRQVPIAALPLTIALRKGRPHHARFRIRSLDGSEHDIQASAFPILTTGGSRGAMAIFWPEGSEA
jgi:PAS domain S-box-containing protein